MEGTTAEWTRTREVGPLDMALGGLLTRSSAELPPALMEAASGPPELVLQRILRLCRPGWTEEHCTIAAARGRESFTAALASHHPLATAIAARMAAEREETTSEPLDH